MATDFTIEPLGDAALLVTFGDAIDPVINSRVHAAAAAVRAADEPWMTPIPAYASLVVGYDAARFKIGDAQLKLLELLESVGPSVANTGAVVEINVVYDGPDLDAVAERCGLTSAQVMEAHSSVLYRAYMLGFSPGFAYLGELPVELELPRRDTPRQRVPAGSVAIAGRQTAVYPQSTPGGWHLIGRTDAVLWDANREPPALIAAGSLVRFVPRA